MEIGVLADTHVTSFEDIPRKIIDRLSRVDLIIHAGDFIAVNVLNGLKGLGEVKAVLGNMDLAELENTLPTKEIIQIKKKRIGITHGSGPPWWELPRRVKKVFDQDQLDIIIYGHSHEPYNEIIDGILFFNPGGAANTFGILTIEDGIKGEILSSQEW